LLTGERDVPKEEIITETFREKCRNGNPFPLIAYQWPQLLVTDEAEQEFFRFFPQDVLERLTPGVRAAIAEPTNPVLRLDWWQLIIIAGFFDETIGELFIKGATGCGKGCAVSIANCLWFDIYHESRVTLTGRDWTHAILTIFGEVKQWFQRMKFPAQCRVLGNEISDGERHYVRVLNPDVSSSTAGEAFSGAHGSNTIYTFDEATSHPDSFFENAEKNARKIIALANPRTLSGRFRDAFKPLGNRIDEIGVCYGNLGNRLCVTIGGPDCMNVRQGRLRTAVAPAGGITINGTAYTAGDPLTKPDHAAVRPLISNQIDLNQFRTICSKGDPRLVGVFAYGRFPTEDPDKQVIMRSWLDFHLEAYKSALPDIECFALDVARSKNGDKTCLAAGGQHGCRELTFWQYNDISMTCSHVVSTIREKYAIDLRGGRHPIVVDMDGLGCGAGDILRASGCWVIEFRGNAGSEVDPRIYGNARAEAYGTLGRRLNPDDRWRGIAWALPYDEDLFEELTAPEKVYSSDGLRFHITPKNTPPGRENSVSVKDKIGRSPDKADAVVYLFAGVRILHDLNEWFRQSQAPLAAWPQPASATAPQIDHAKPQPNDPPILTHLREQYGNLIERDESPAVDWKRFYKQQVAEQQSAEAATDPAGEHMPAAPPAQQHWTSRIWGD
jgi:hypothetical protein